MKLRFEGWADFWPMIISLGLPILIIWLGNHALGRIDDLYDGLCEVQGPGMAPLLYEGKRDGYCTGIGDYLDILEYIMWAAAITTYAVVVLVWQEIANDKARLTKRQSTDENRQ
jgi:hypothetical protein